MNYLVLSTPSESYAESISSALWGIRRPSSVRSEFDTQLYTYWATKPDGSAVALFVPDDIFRIHAEADIDELVNLVTDLDLTIEVETLEGTEMVTTTLSAYLESNRGESMKFLDIINASALSAHLRTRDQLEAEGWFPEPNLT